MKVVIDFILNCITNIVAFVIPTFQSYTILGSKDNESTRSCIRYWIIIFLLEAIFRLITPIFNKLCFSIVYIKLPFLIWVSNPSIKGFESIYIKIIDDGYVKSMENIHEQIMERVVKPLRKKIKDVKGVTTNSVPS